MELIYMRKATGRYLVVTKGDGQTIGEIRKEPGRRRWHAYNKNGDIISIGQRGYKHCKRYFEPIEKPAYMRLPKSERVMQLDEYWVSRRSVFEAFFNALPADVSAVLNERQILAIINLMRDERKAGLKQGMREAQIIQQAIGG